jgi:hypothetical protein
MRHFESCLDLVVLELLIFLDAWQAIEIRVILEPQMEVLIGVKSIVLIGAAHT